jgi:WhiB family redox-sensing transcriptional regulator
VTFDLTAGDDDEELEAGRSWWERGACVGHDPELFFPDNTVDQAAALAVCRRCPVRAECLDHALTHEKFGVWGGTGQRERARLRRQRGIRLDAGTGGGPNQRRRP